MSRKAAWVLLGGRWVVPSAASALWLPAPSRVIAADGGARHAATLNVPVDVWVGDFDSSDDLHLDAPKQVHPVAKDQTDGELAFELAMEDGIQEVALLGAFGGRFDHAAATVLGAIEAAGQGLCVTLSSGDEWAWPLVPEQPFSLEGVPEGSLLSVLAFSLLTGLSLSGVRWTLSGADVPCGSGWTLSNETVAPVVSASLAVGRALVVIRPPT